MFVSFFSCNQNNYSNVIICYRFLFRGGNDKDRSKLKEEEKKKKKARIRGVTKSGRVIKGRGVFVSKEKNLFSFIF